jgi:drug/metabolite transporter (DMT)-like permease
MTRSRKIAYFALMTTMVIWGIASPVIKHTLQFIGPFAFLFWRFLLVALIFLPVFFVYKRKKSIKLSRKTLIKLALLGTLGTTISLGFLFTGLKYTTAIDGSLIYSTAPIMVVVGGALFLKEIITKREKIGTVLAFSGSIVVVIQPALEGKAFTLENIGGNLLVLGSAVTWAAYCLMVRQLEFKEKVDPLILTAIGFFAGLITVIPLFLWEQAGAGRFMLDFNRLAIPGLLYMSIISSVIAYFTYHLGYSLIEASEATVFDYLKPVVAAPVAVVWLGEKITLPFLIGAGIITMGVLLTESRPKQAAA